jgi:phospholipid-translocating ATPase
MKELFTTAPRFVVKFVSTAYFPLDKHIVREMWVNGDLKDRLGIRHRKSKRNHQKDLEYTPMFHEPHTRSRSDVDDLYEPTMSAATKEQVSEDAQPTNYTPRPREPMPTAAPRVQDTHRPPGYLTPPEDRPDHTTSPRASYYSVSDLPVPSPLPPPIFRYSNGETTTTPPSRSASIARKMSLASRTASPGIYSPSPPPGRSLPSVQLTAPSRPTSSEIAGRHTGVSGDPGTYEMRVRNVHTPHSQASSAAAQDEFWSADEGDDEDDVTVDAHGDDQLHRLGQQLRTDANLTAEARGYQFDPDEDSRRTSSASWQGGLAL